MRRAEQVCSGKSVESYFKSLLPESPRACPHPRFNEARVYFHEQRQHGGDVVCPVHSLAARGSRSRSGKGDGLIKQTHSVTSGATSAFFVVSGVDRDSLLHVYAANRSADI